MKLLAIVGSMREGKNTDRLVHRVIEDLSSLDPDFEAEVIRSANMAIEACRVTCSGFCAAHPFRCSIADDAMLVFEKMLAADAILLATPLYFRAPPARFHTLMERLISLHFFRETQGPSDQVPPLSGKNRAALLPWPSIPTLRACSST